MEHDCHKGIIVTKIDNNTELVTEYFKMLIGNKLWYNSKTSIRYPNYSMNLSDKWIEINTDSGSYREVS